MDRRDRSPETIIALIDVVFFLLVFFMLIGRMDATAPFDVTPATSQSGSDMPGGGLTVAISAEGDLAVDGALATAQEVLALLQERLAADPGVLVRVNAHKDAELRRILPLVAELKDAGARDVMLVVTPETP